MATYEYVCTSCAQRTEARQSFSDPPLEICPNCGGELKRVFHPVGIVLKGSGFYSTDNRSSRKGAGKERDKEPAKSETKTETKTSSKPEGSGSSDKPAS
jgi:putative FmdB family regulatory protein